MHWTKQKLAIIVLAAIAIAAMYFGRDHNLLFKIVSVIAGLAGASLAGYEVGRFRFES